jgi:hypothetical protein
LCIPDISLCPEECITRTTTPDSNSPLEELVECAECYAECNGDDIGPICSVYDFASDEYLSRDEYRDKSLYEVPDLIIVVARLSEVVSYPVKKWHLRIRVVSTDTEDDSMYEDKCVEEVCERELLVCEYEYSESENCREDFECPCEVVVWTDARPEEYDEEDCREPKWISHRWIVR